MATKNPGIRSRGPNRWQLIVSVRAEDGRHRQVTETFHGSLTGARKRRAEMAADVYRKHRGGSTVTLGELLDRWLIDIEAEGRADTTLYSYRCRVKTIKKHAVAAVQLGRLRAADLNGFYAWVLTRGRSANDARHYHAVFSAALNHAMALEWLHYNVAKSARPPKVVKKPVIAPSAEDVALILKAAREVNPELAVFFRLSSTIGARCGEVCAIRWDDLELMTGATVVIDGSVTCAPGMAVHRKTTKTNRARRIDLDPETVRQVVAHMERMRHRAEVLGMTKLVENPYLFSNRLDGSVPLRPDNVTNAFRSLRKQAGVDGVRLHDLRHFVASQLLAAGRPVTEVAYRLGHASAHMTLTVYGHFIPSAGTEAADVMASLLAG